MTAIAGAARQSLLFCHKALPAFLTTPAPVLDTPRPLVYAAVQSIAATASKNRIRLIRV